MEAKHLQRAALPATDVLRHTDKLVVHEAVLRLVRLVMASGLQDDTFTRRQGRLCGTAPSAGSLWHRRRSSIPRTCPRLRTNCRRPTRRLSAARNADPGARA